MRERRRKGFGRRLRIVEIILRQRTGEALRIGALRSVRVGARVRIDGRDDWVVTRCLPPISAGGPRRVVCERLAGDRRAG